MRTSRTAFTAPVFAATATLALAASLVLGAAVPASAATGSDHRVDLSTPGSVGNSTVGASILPGWKLPTGGTIDGEVTSAGEFRLSSSKSPIFSHLGYVTPPLEITAGETGTGDVNTFDASFTVSPGVDGYQDGLSVGVALNDASQGWNRYGGNVMLLHSDGVLKVGTFWLDESKNTGERPVTSSALEWSEAFFADLDPTVAHTIRAVVRFVDGPANDVVDYYVDDTLAFTGTTWEGFAAIKNLPATAVGSLGFFVGANTASTTGIPTVGGITAQPALEGKGLRFSDIAYSSYSIEALPTAPAPDVEPAPAATPDVPLEAPASAETGGVVTVNAGGFDPFENVHFTWYSTPTFAGWAQANARGVVSASFTVPASLLSGSTHTLQGVGARSGVIANARLSIALADTGATTATPLLLLAAGLTLLGAGSLGISRLRRQQ